MKRTISFLSVLSLAVVMIFATLGQTAWAQQTGSDKVSKYQLTALIATAKTQAEHETIAKDYRDQAQDYLAQAKEHEAMVAAYKASPNMNSKNKAATIDHCQYFVGKFEEMAVHSQDLAQLHEQMAKDAAKK